MLQRQPGWRRGRRRGEVDAHSTGVQQVEHLIQPGEVELAVTRLDLRPGEDADRREVHPRLVHQPDIVAPDLRRPLLRVVVAAIPESTHSLTLPLASPVVQYR